MTVSPDHGHDPGIGLAIIIDDEKVDQMIYRRVMVQSGLVRETLAFSMAEEALEFLRRKDRSSVDVVFLDINMPRMNGIEFLEEAVREFGEDFARLVVVMLTSAIDPSDHDHVSSFRAVRQFLYKPLTAAHVGQVSECLAGLDLPDQTPADTYPT